MFIAPEGTSHHGRPGDLDYDADQDHVPIDNDSYGKVLSEEDRPLD